MIKSLSLQYLSVKKYHLLLPLALLLMVHTCNNTDSNQLVILSGIALYYGDTYMLFLHLRCCAWVSVHYTCTKT